MKTENRINEADNPKGSHSNLSLLHTQQKIQSRFLSSSLSLAPLQTNTCTLSSFFALSSFLTLIQMSTGLYGCISPTMFAGKLSIATFSTSVFLRFNENQPANFNILSLWEQKMNIKNAVELLTYQISSPVKYITNLVRSRISTGYVDTWKQQ